MKTEVLSGEFLEKAAFFLRKGLPIAFPTETVYGLGAPVFYVEAIKRVFIIKGRPSDNPLIVHVSSLSQVDLVAQNLSAQFYELAEKYWPGPLTLVVEKREAVPEIVTAGLTHVAIRMPSHPIALKLIDAVGPLVAPSANLSGKPSPTSTEDVMEDLEGKVPIILEGGRCSVGIESTVLSLADEKPTLLRPGVVPFDAALPTETTAIASPGMKYRHYAPKAEVKLITSKKDLQGPFILSTNPEGEMHLLNEHTLYHELRVADRMGAKEILIDCSEDLLQNQALMNRIFKAAGKNRLECFSRAVL